MSDTIQLDAIEQGVATAAEARKAIASILKHAQEPDAANVYTALRAWVWKALDGRRRDPELREWYGLLEGVEGRLTPNFPDYANRIQALYELVSESIAVAETVSVEHALERNHVRQILLLLKNSEHGALGRAVIGEHLNLKQANLTRVLNLMSLAGLIERLPKGREAVFRLTSTGHAETVKIAHAITKDAAHLTNTIALPPLRPALEKPQYLSELSREFANINAAEHHLIDEHTSHLTDHFSQKGSIRYLTEKMKQTLITSKIEKKMPDIITIEATPDKYKKEYMYKGIFEAAQ